MIRFIPLSYEDTGFRFAFWDTIINRFSAIGGDEAWEDLADFKESAAPHLGPALFARYAGLIPDALPDVDKTTPELSPTIRAALRANGYAGVEAMAEYPVLTHVISIVYGVAFKEGTEHAAFARMLEDDGPANGA